ncbi:uncharacterized protein BKA78DRAFT_303721, partial [Phyllosticta capitalensis]
MSSGTPRPAAPATSRSAGPATFQTHGTVPRVPQDPHASHRAAAPAMIDAALGSSQPGLYPSPDASPRLHRAQLQPPVPSASTPATSSSGPQPQTPTAIHPDVQMAALRRRIASDATQLLEVRLQRAEHQQALQLQEHYRAAYQRRCAEHDAQVEAQLREVARLRDELAAIRRHDTRRIEALQRENIQLTQEVESQREERLEAERRQEEERLDKERRAEVAERRLRVLGGIFGVSELDFVFQDEVMDS